MNLAIKDVRLIRVDAWPGSARQRTKGGNIWGIGPINPFLDYVPRPEQWEPDFDIEDMLKYALGNCDEVWKENGYVLFSTVGKTSQGALRKLEANLTQRWHNVSHWCTGWKRSPVYGRHIKVQYQFIFPPEMVHGDTNQQ